MEQVKSERFLISLSPKQKEALSDLAHLKRVSMAEYIRHSLENAVLIESAKEEIKAHLETLTRNSYDSAYKNGIKTVLEMLNIELEGLE